MKVLGRRPRSWAVVLSMGLVVVFGAAATTGAFIAVRTAGVEYGERLLDGDAEDVISAIDDQVDRYGETLSDLAYAIGAQSGLTRTDFTRITAGLNAQRFPGATGVVYVVAAEGGQFAALEQHWRRQGASGLRLTPAPVRGEHDFVVFDKPLTPGPGLPGRDLAASAPVAGALRVARHSGTLALSAAHQLLRDSDRPAAQRQTSVVLAVPVFAGGSTADPDAFDGWLVMGLHGQDFLDQPLLEREHNNVQVRLVDPGERDTTIAAVSPGVRLSDPALVRQESIAVGQRRWHVTIWPTTRLHTATDQGLDWLTLGAGTALTLLLAVLTAVLISSRNHALEQVDRATQALRQDITHRENVEARLRERERELQHLAFHDPLTGLANRTLLYERLSQAIATRPPGELAVLFVDLDGFKPINDRHGHDAGDLVLRTTATRLVDNVRAGDTVGRLGGDEFAVILTGLSAPDDARAAADHIVAAIGRPIELADTTVSITASIGIAISRPGADAQDILAEADTAMYAAKANGKGCSILADS